MVPRGFILSVLLSVWIGTTRAESVLFPSNVALTSVNATTVDDAAEYVDPGNTGSYLFDSEATTKTMSKKLALNINVSQFKSKAAGARYFRAHPTFLKCAMHTLLQLNRDEIPVTISRAYITTSESSGSDTDLRLQSGCAMELELAGSVGTVEDIAAAVLKVCPLIVERELRDLGITIMADNVLFFMSGPDATGPDFRLDGYNGIANLQTWVQEQINAGLEPSFSSMCDNYTPLSSGEHHPSAHAESRAVGTMDIKFTRDMSRDFQRLVQYQGSNIAFENTEGSAAWCGKAGSVCPSTCADGIQGNSAANRCADRVVSSRMLTVLNKLQKKARLAMSDKLKVTEAWDEPYDGQTSGDNADGSLHYEGRAVKVMLVSGTASKLGELSKYAICAGADYVEHKGDHLYISVKRARAGGVKVKFPNVELLEVQPPTEVEALYNLPAVFTDAEAKEYPLFDSGGREAVALSSAVTIGQLKSKDYRYFRANPRLVECLVDVVYHENKRNQAGDPAIEIEVVRGFLTNQENNRKFDIINDKRFNTHNMGRAMQIKYKNESISPYRLLYTVIDKCAARFYQTKKEMGVGLYSNSVFVDIRRVFHLMEDSLDHLPAGVNKTTFEEDIEDRYLLARDRRIVDPSDLETARLFSNAPSPQSPEFIHVHTETTKRKRRRKRAANDKSCVPTRSTTFCSSTLSHRQAVVAEITSQLDMKHYTHRSREEIMEALKGCFLDCGTCLEGEVYDDKVEHCNNFLHWVDWQLLNTESDTTNFFVRTNRNAVIHACEGGSDCVENSPLFSLVAPSVEKIYRPDPTKSVEEELYSTANNPLPVFKLLEDIYAIQASGIVKFWVKDDTEMTSLKRQLEVVMLYNKNVTKIQIYVERYRIAADRVGGIVETAAGVMTSQGNPDITRATLTPYEVLEVPPEKKKRAAEPDSLRYQVRDYHKNYEARWAARNCYL